MSKKGEGRSLGQYALLRIAQALPLIIAIIIINFLLINLAPGDPVTALIGEFPVPQEYVEEMRANFGLDQNIAVRLVRYLGNVLRGDLGFSFNYRVPVLDLVLNRLGRTIILMISAITFASIVGISLGVAAAKWRNSFIDNFAVAFATIGYSIPVFWSGQILILIFAIWLGWLPSGGLQSIRGDYFGWALIVDRARHMILPMLALSLRYMALTTRLTRSSLLETLNSDFILAAKSSGVKSRGILWNHGLRNAAMPIITVVGFHFTFMVAGSALVETVFGWPGIGRLLYTSITARDFPVLLGILLVVSVAVILVTLITDLLYAFVDPRVTYD